MKKIAVLAWGSLTWDKRDLRIADQFEPTGPRLPIEFCRVSGGKRLTLVIDEINGAECITYQARSSFDSLEAAIENLGDREGTTTANMGFVDVEARKKALTPSDAIHNPSRKFVSGQLRTVMTQ